MAIIWSPVNIIFLLIFVIIMFIFGFIQYKAAKIKLFEFLFIIISFLGILTSFIKEDNLFIKNGYVNITGRLTKFILLSLWFMTLYGLQRIIEKIRKKHPDIPAWDKKLNELTIKSYFMYLFFSVLLQLGSVVYLINAIIWIFLLFCLGIINNIGKLDFYYIVYLTIPALIAFWIYFEIGFFLNNKQLLKLNEEKIINIRRIMVYFIVGVYIALLSDNDRFIKLMKGIQMSKYDELKNFFLSTMSLSFIAFEQLLKLTIDHYKDFKKNINKQVKIEN